MILPTINTYSVNQDKIALFWLADKTNEVKTWNLYGTAQVDIDFFFPNNGVVVPGSFTKIVEGIKNVEHNITPNSCYIELTRDFLGIGAHEPYNFLLTYTDHNNVESSLDLNKIHAVQLYDAFFVDEAGQPINVVYKNFEFVLPPCPQSEDRYLDVTSLLGRPAKQLRIDSVAQDPSGYSGNIFITMNSISGDPISVRYSTSYPFELLRGGLQVHKVFFYNPGFGDATIRLFVAG